MSDEPDDWSDPATPLPPDDRLWRHPSEVARGAVPAAAPATPGSAPANPGGGPWHTGRRGLLAVAVVSGVTGAAITVVALAAVGSLSPRTVERVEQARTTAVVATTAVRRSASSVAAEVAPAVVQVSATDGAARRKGSGVVVRSDGLILTSAALVVGADAVVVTWASGQAEPATLRGHDNMTGLAALSVETGSHPEVDTTSAAPQPGEVAITVGGSAGPSGPTLTQGVISATSTHADPEHGRLLGLIETDQPVPDWADGGALVDGEGRLLGVCLSVPEQATTGFAVPMDAAARVASELVATGRVDRGWLGVRGAESDASAGGPAGLEVEEVAPASPADQADIRTGDVLTSVDGHPVRSLADVQAALTLSRPGDEITVRRARDDQVSTIEVDLGTAPG